MASVVAARDGNGALGGEGRDAGGEGGEGLMQVYSKVTAVMIERWDGLCESGAWRKSWGQRRLRTFHTVRVAAPRVVARGVAAARADLSCGEKPPGR